MGVHKLCTIYADDTARLFMSTLYFLLVRNAFRRLYPTTSLFNQSERNFNNHASEIYQFALIGYLMNYTRRRHTDSDAWQRESCRVCFAVHRIIRLLGKQIYVLTCFVLFVCLFFFFFFFFFNIVFLFFTLVINTSFTE